MITEDQAYAAMYFFIEKINSRLNSSDLGSLLGDISLLPDGSSADPAVDLDWEKAIERAKSGEAPFLKFK